MNKIGFYNPKVDNSENLHECNAIYSDFEALKSHIEYGDTVKLSSSLSLFDADMNEVLSLKDQYNLKFITVDCTCNNQPANTLTLLVTLSMLDFIKMEKDKILKLLQ